MKCLGSISCIWPSEWNHSIYQIHYTGVTWALWRLESLATLLIVQQLLHVNKLEENMSILPALCEKTPQVTSGSPNKGPLMLTVYYFDRNYTDSHFSGTRHFSDGLFYHYNGVIISTVASQITSFTIVYSTVSSGAGTREHQSYASLAFVGNSPVTDEFPTQRASNAENVSMWWRHHVTHMHHWTSWYLLLYVSG